MIDVLLADDHAIVRQGLVALLAKEPDIQVIAEAENGHDAIEKTGLYRPDVIVMDYSMPGLNGLESTRRIVRKHSKTRVIVLSMHANEEYILQFLRAGAAGYLLKDSIATDLIEAIHHVMRSPNFYSPSIPPATLKQFIKKLKNGDYVSPLESLTNREREILQVIAEGLSNKEIAAQLCISVKTVETHRANVMSKLDIHDPSSLTRFAIVHGIINLDGQLPSEAQLQS
jgi:DNA-binding NarL/FixJ family response regulator